MVGSVAADEGPALIDAYSDFLQLVDALRARGATRVRDGALEADFDRPAVAPAESASAAPRRALDESELEELQQLRIEKSRWEELP